MDSNEPNEANEEPKVENHVHYSNNDLEFEARDNDEGISTFAVNGPVNETPNRVVEDEPRRMATPYERKLESVQQDPDDEERAYSQLETGQNHDHQQDSEEPERMYEEDSIVMAAESNQLMENEINQNEDSDRLTQSILSGEPRITHSASKYLSDHSSLDLLQQSIGGYDLESVRGVFKFFDYQNDDSVKYCDIPELLRCLNFNPTKAEANEIAKDIAPDEKPITWDAFVPKVIELIESGKYHPAAEEEILAAFCTFDPDLSGFVTVQQLKDALTMFGEPLNDEEFEDLLKYAPRDPKSGKVNYKEYCKELCMIK